MSFKNNFSKLYLLTNKPVYFWNETTDFYLNIPTVFDVYTNSDFAVFTSILEKEPAELSKFFANYKVQTPFDFITVISAISQKNEEALKLYNTFLKSLQILVPTIYFDKVYFIKEGIPLTRELFEEIIEILFISLDKETIIIKSTDDEFTKIEKEAALRAQKIRAKGKKEDADGKPTNSFENLLAALIYEFPQYKLEDLFKLNVYTLNFLFKQIGKIANYEVSKIAAGNGLTKKHHYFIDTK